MTDEQRLDRLERIVRLLIKASYRSPQEIREQREKIKILIDRQLRDKELFMANQERIEGDQRHG
jgi:hypothetical protein